MKKNILRFICCSLSALLILSMSACKQTEFIPDPEGVKVPFEDDATQTVEQLLAASSAKIYYAAWQRSNFKSTIAAKGNKFQLTIFAPDDAAMQAAGFSSAAIQAMPVEEVDSLLMFYTTAIKVTVDDLKRRDDNFALKSMLERPGVFVTYFENPNSYPGGYDHYFYRTYVALRGDELLLNGKSAGKVNYAPAINGGLYVLTKTVERPFRTKLETLQADGRFSMYLEALRRTDEMFVDKIGSDIEPLFGYRPEPEEIKRDYAYMRIFYETGLVIDPPRYPGFLGINIIMSTTFAPTDEAFHKAGFQTVEDLLRLNVERGDARFDTDYFEVRGGYPLDTLLNFHTDWGRFYAPRDPSYGIASANATVFYSNVLNPALNNYIINVGGSTQSDYAYKMPLAFSTNNNRVQVQVPGSTRQAASVLEADINTLNGPIHVVDQLLIPNGFKLN